MSELKDGDVKEMAKKYAERWKVSEEEAEKSIRDFASRDPAGKKIVMPTEANLFPEPATDFAKKVMGIGQATVSLAHTQDSLRRLGQPSEKIVAIEEDVANLKKTLNETLELVNSTVKDLKTTLEGKLEDEKQKKLFDDIEERVIKPLKEDLENVKKELEEKPPRTKENLRTMREEIKSFEEDARGTLEELGIEVPEKRVLKEGPPVPETDQELVAELKRRGFKVEYDMISREDAKKMAEEARTGVKDDKLEKARIDAVADIVKEAMRGLFDMFTEPLQAWMEASMTAPPGPPGGPPGEAETSKPKEQSAPSES